jgi:hypothetical protein
MQRRSLALIGCAAAFAASGCAMGIRPGIKVSSLPRTNGNCGPRSQRLTFTGFPGGGPSGDECVIVRTVRRAFRRDWHGTTRTKVRYAGVYPNAPVVWSCSLARHATGEAEGEERTVLCALDYERVSFRLPAERSR